MLELLLEKHKVSILLPGAYSITPQAVCEISNLSWIKGIEIDTNSLLI
jgi:DNA polymerase-3 subunit alpha